MWRTKARLAISFATESLATSVPQALTILAFAVAGIVSAWICLLLGDFFSRRANIGNKSRWRSFFLLFGITLLLVAFSIGFNAAGFNFWTIILSYGILSLFVGTMYSEQLKCIGAYSTISFTRKIEEGYMIECNGKLGTVRHIHFFWVSIVTKDGVSIQLPTWWFISSAVEIRSKPKDINGINIHQQ
jgi:small-conductance mechanosensitive channel